MADGGEGTVDAFLGAGAQARTVSVQGPLSFPVEARYALDGDLAVLEAASASGLALTAAGQRDVLRASSFGTGELIRAALEAGARRIVIGIGGTATNDAGGGMLSALGVRFLDRGGRLLEAGGGALAQLHSIDMSSIDTRVNSVILEVAADVDNVLCGPNGASVMFGPQKGASGAQVTQLDAALSHFADIVAARLGRDERNYPGAGAAGGLGFALRAFLGARLRPGVEIIAELRGLEDALRTAQLCLTGEGRIDRQTLRGKTVAGVAMLAKKQGVPVVAFAGRVDRDAEDALFARGVRCVPIMAGPTSLARATHDAAVLLEAAATRCMRLLL